MAEAKNPYKILGVPRDASKEQVRSAYIHLARKYHPDMHPPGDTYAEQMFKEVASAYEVLSDDALRARYDEGPDYTFSRARRAANVPPPAPPRARPMPTKDIRPPAARRSAGGHGAEAMTWIAVIFGAIVMQAFMSLAMRRPGSVSWVLLPILVLTTVCATSAVVTWKAAARRGKDPATWFAIGAVSFFVAAIILHFRLPAGKQARPFW